MPPQLLREFRQRHPEVERGQAVTLLGGVYCRDLLTASQASDVDRQTRLIAFMARVAAQETAAR